jgi:3',5'-cyclic-AMP phosphodiesterase
MGAAAMDNEHPSSAGSSRRTLLTCLAWTGTGIAWTMAGGVPQASQIGLGGEALAASADFTFIQISDSHIGFKGAVNPAPDATLRQALDRIASLPVRPAMMIHTGDVSHLSKPAEFDAAEQILKGAGLDIHFVPGEHDVIGDDGKEFFARFSGRNRAPGGWYSWDQGGIHFVALVNVFGFKPATGGSLGAEQIEWLEKDLKPRSASTPIVVMAHVPLWPVYPEWGWATDDAAQALQHLKRFGSVTVLNGHIHQIVQKVEGHASFRTALSTAFPQPPGGQGPGPGPMKVAADRLKRLLGLRTVKYMPGAGVAATDITLA